MLDLICMGFAEPLGTRRKRTIQNKNLFLMRGSDLCNSVPHLDWSMTPGCKARGRWFDPLWTYIFIMIFSLSSNFSQLCEAHTCINEIKYNIHPGE